MYDVLWDKLTRVSTLAIDHALACQRNIVEPTEASQSALETHFERLKREVRSLERELKRLYPSNDSSWLHVEHFFESGPSGLTAAGAKQVVRQIHEVFRRISERELTQAHLARV